MKSVFFFVKTEKNIMRIISTVVVVVEVIHIIYEST